MRHPGEFLWLNVSGAGKIHVAISGGTVYCAVKNGPINRRQISGFLYDYGRFPDSAGCRTERKAAVFL